MIAATAIFIYIIYLSLTNGLLVNKLVNRLFKFDEVKVPFSMIILTGLAFITSIASLLSLFIKTGLITNLFFLLIGTSYLILDKDNANKILSDYIKSIKEISIFTWILGLGLLFLVYYQTASITLNADTPGYHALSIKYIENYPAIKGLGNLYHRLGFNNSWFVTNAVFSLSFLGIQSFNLLGHFLMLFVGSFILGGLNGIVNNQKRLSDWMRLILIPVFLYSWYFPHIGWTSTPSPDIPAALFTWMYFVYVIRLIEDKSFFNINVKHIHISILAAFLITIKLSVIPVIIPILFFLVKIFQNNRKNALSLLAIGLLIVIPWMSRNFIVSGYIIHPFPALDIADPEWKIPNEIAEKEKRTIQKWAKWPGWFKKPEGKKLEDLTFSEWYDVWIKNQTLPYISLLFNGLIILGFLNLAYGLYLLIKTKDSSFLILNTTLIISMLFWLLQGPDLRFGWGFIFISASIFTFNVIGLITSRIKFDLDKKARLSIAGIIGLLILFNYYSFFDIYQERLKFFGYKFSNERIFLPADYPVSFGSKVFEIENEIYFYENDMYYSPLPAGQRIKEFKKVTKLGENFEDGFKAVIKDE